MPELDRCTARHEELWLAAGWRWLVGGCVCVRACVFDVESRPVPQLIKNEWRAKGREELSAVAGARLTLASLADALPLPPGAADYFRSPIPALPQPLPGFPSGSATAVGVFIRRYLEQAWRY